MNFYWSEIKIFENFRDLRILKDNIIRTCLICNNDRFLISVESKFTLVFLLSLYIYVVQLTTMFFIYFIITILMVKLLSTW